MSDLPEQSVIAHRCEKCDRPLPVLGEGNAVVLGTIFPDMVLNCLVHLEDGPGALPCSNCKHVNHLGVPQAVAYSDGRGLLYMPDAMAEGSADEQRAVNAYRGTLGRDPLIVRGRRAFRRAFIEMFINQHVRLLNDFILTGDNLNDWIARHEKELDHNFFAACWLASTGALAIVGRRPAQEIPEGVLPEEQTTDAERHVSHRQEIEHQVALNVGHVIAGLLTVWALRIMQGRSFAAFLEAAPGLVPKIALIGDIAERAADKIGDFVDKFKPGEPGAILGRYIFEATLAVLFSVHDLRNPRRSRWTASLTVYEYMRRVEGNDESVLLDPELLRKTIDQDEFLKGIRIIGADLGQLNSEKQERFSQLLETVERILPDEVGQFVQAEMTIKDDISDADALTQIMELFDAQLAAFKLETWNAVVPALMRGLQRGRPKIVAQAIRAMWAKTADRLEPEHRLQMARWAIEMLNLSQRYRDAYDIAKEAETLMANVPGLSRQLRMTVLNEVGNCLRYLGEFEAALERYEAAEEALGDEVGRNKRVVIRNRAIVLRSMHRFAEARRLFARLRAETRDLELLHNVASEANTLTEMGDSKAALALLDEYESLAAGQSVMNPAVRDYAMLRGQLLSTHGRQKEAAELAGPLLQYSVKMGDALTAAVAARIRFDSSDENLAQADRDKLANEALVLLHEGLERAREVQGIPTALLALTEELSKTLIRLGRYADAEKAVREAAEQFDPESAPRGWLLHLHAMRLAMHRDDFQTAIGDMAMGLAWLDQGLAQAAAMTDAISFLAPHRRQVEELTGFVHSARLDDNPEAQWLARIAADVIAAPVLTARVRASLGMPSPTRVEPADEATAIRDFFRETPAAILQTIRLDERIGLLTTVAGQDGSVQSALRLLSIDLDPDEIQATLRRLDFRLRNASPTASSLALETVRGWPQLKEALRSAIDEIPIETPLCVVPGLLSSLPFSLTFGSERPLCFAPSLGLQLALRERRRRLPGGMTWRPTQMFDFAVWRLGDKPAVAQALQEAVTTGMVTARESGLLHEAKLGKEGDSQALLEGLRRADLTRIACHGRILPNEDALDLVVAADGLLPPASAAGLAGDEATGHILSWQRLAELNNASPVVFSSACDSGAAILHGGGERLGLERSLFAAGTVTYVAPQWPVPVIAIQQFFSMMLHEYLKDPTRSLALILRDTRAKAMAAGLSPLAYSAAAVFGDGL